MFLELLEGPIWETWSEPPKRKAATTAVVPLPLASVRTEIAGTDEERADLLAAARAKDSDCDKALDDPRSAADIAGAPLPKDADDNVITDVCMYGLLARSPEDAALILDKVPTDRWCWNCRATAAALPVAKGEVVVAPLVRLIEKLNESLLEAMPTVATPALFPVLLRDALRSDDDNTLPRRHIRRFPNGVAKLALAIAAGADPTAVGVSEKPQTWQEGSACAAARCGLLVSVMARIGCEDAVHAAARELGLEDTAREWIAMPPFIPYVRASSGRLPKNIVLEGKKLDETKTKRLFELFQRVDWSIGGRDLALLREALDPKSRKAIANALAGRWKRRSGEPWNVLIAVALEPDRADVLASTQVIAHRSRSYTQKRIERTAVAAIAHTAVAFPEKRDLMLSRLGSLALDPIKKRQHLRRAAEQTLEAVAEALGLPVETLDDRTIPSLGLDANASMTLDWGGRPVDVRMTPALEIVFVVDGEKRSAQPSPRKGDSKKKVAAAKKIVERLRTEGRVLALGLGPRVTRWMRDRQRWARDDFTKYVLGHPVLRAVARGFVWGTFDDGPFGGKLLGSFRVAEDGTFADVDDGVTTLSGARIGLLHPGELEPDLSRRWGTIMADYELLSLVPQLDLRTLTAEEAASDAIQRTTDAAIYSSRVPPGWEYAQGRGVTAWERTVGRYRLLIEYAYQQKTLTGRVRLREQHRDVWLKWGEVDRVAAHEMLLDVDEVGRK